MSNVFCVALKIFRSIKHLTDTGNAIEKLICMVAWKDDKYMLNRIVMHNMENKRKPKKWVDQRFREYTQTQCVWVCCDRGGYACSTFSRFTTQQNSVEFPTTNSVTILGRSSFSQRC